MLISWQPCEDGNLWPEITDDTFTDMPKPRKPVCIVDRMLFFAKNQHTRRLAHKLEHLCATTKLEYRKNYASILCCQKGCEGLIQQKLDNVALLRGSDSNKCSELVSKAALSVVELGYTTFYM